jgi:hypothetical protein
MSLSTFFTKLGAPLANVRWSWGSVRPDGSVVLRVWQDRTKKFDDKLCVQLTHLEKYGDGRGADNLGYSERLEHLQLIRNGAKAILVMCLAKDPTASPREILSFNKEDVFIGGSLRNVDGDTWIELASRVPIKSVI